MPIGWGKCYTAESPTQVHAIIDQIWDGHPEHKPAIMAYDSLIMQTAVAYCHTGPK